MQLLRAHTLNKSIEGAYTLLWGDMLRVYRLLPSGLQRQVYFLFCGMLLAALLEVLSIASLSFLGGVVVAPSSIASNPFWGPFLKLSPYKITDITPMTLVFTASCVVCGIFALKNLIQGLVMWKVSRLGENIGLALGKQLFRSYLYSPYMWHLSGNSSTTFTALTKMGSLAQMLIHVLNVYVYALTAIALFITLFSATPGTIFSTIALTGALAVIIYSSLKRGLDSSSKTIMQSDIGSNTSLFTAQNGIRDVLIYGQQEAFLEGYATKRQEGIAARTFVATAPPIPSWILESLGIAIIPASIWIMAKNGQQDMVSIASVLSIVMLVAWRILPTVNRSLSALIAIRAIRHTALLSLESLENQQPDHLQELPAPSPDFAIQKSISLNAITFTYPGKELPVLRDVTLVIPKGKKVGIIGLSGAGKSTVAGLLSGLLSPQSGQIMVDEYPLKGALLAAYMQRVGYVSQSPYLFSGTLAANVAFSRWGKDFDREKVREVCRMAALDIAEKDAGIDTVIHERGAGLSGGQAQRVCIARALFASPEILIFDESTSSLDQANESAIMQTIFDLKNVTTVIIAHRLTSLERCDHIYWLDEGKLRANGPVHTIIPQYKKWCTTVKMQDAQDVNENYTR